MMDDTMPFSEFVEINPKVTLKKGIEYPFVEMDIVTPGRRYVSSFNKRIYKGGGAKFQFGDTLFARITPCLENGKITQFSGAKDEIGFGSTEFFVFRHKRNGKNPIIITKQAAKQQNLIGSWLHIENPFMEKILTKS